MNNNILNRPVVFFKDRTDAGQRLCPFAKRYVRDHPLILGLARGGVVVAYEIARQLRLRLSVIVTCKIGDPVNPELGIGAVSENGVLVLDQAMIRYLSISSDQVKQGITRGKEEVIRRVKHYRKSQPIPPLVDQTVIVVDDGLATGVTAEASIKAVKKMHPQRILFAVPVCEYDTAAHIRSEIDDLICLSAPRQMEAIGLYYRHFEQVPDKEVVRLLGRVRA